MRRPLLPILLAASTVLGCSNTKIQSVWRDAAFQRGSIQKILVIGIFPTTGVREAVEGQFVARLKDERLEPWASNGLLGADQIDRARVEQVAKEKQLDGVLLARILDRQTLEKYYSPQQANRTVTMEYQDDWYQYYVQSVDEIPALGYSDQSRIDARLETKLFDARTGKLVWSALSDTQIDGRNVRQIEDAVAKIVDAMRRGNVF
jgi:hypothetical protein